MPWRVPVEQIIYETALKLLTPFRTSAPGAVEAALELLAHNSPPEQAGQVLLEAWEDQIAQIKKEDINKQSSLYQRIDDLERQLREAQQEIRKEQNEIDQLCRKSEADQKVIVKLQENISVQNRLLVQQHEQIMNLCGMQNDDPHP